jgi:hypothetical protein
MLREGVATQKMRAVIVRPRFASTFRRMVLPVIERSQKWLRQPLFWSWNCTFVSVAVDKSVSSRTPKSFQCSPIVEMKSVLGDWRG